MKKHLLCMCAICILGFTLTGCGTSTTTGSTSGNNDPTLGQDTTENGDSVADDIGNAATDIADGVGTAVDDLVGGNGFDNYNDAHDYFLDTMGNYHSDAKFELRDEDQNLMDYQEGSKGYRFTLYDSSNNDAGEKFGEFYVDATSGLIYRKGDDGAISEYPTKNNSTTGNNSNGNKTNNNNTNNSNVNGNNTTESKNSTAKQAKNTSAK